jgi:hypothetical protein
LFGKIHKEVYIVRIFLCLKKDGIKNFPGCGWRVLRLILLDIEIHLEMAVPYIVV